MHGTLHVVGREVSEFIDVLDDLSTMPPFECRSSAIEYLGEASFGGDDGTHECSIRLMQ